MYFFYIDESGNSGLHPHPTEPVHWLVGVAVHARAVRQIEAQMLSLAIRFFGRRARDADFEFHGADLFTGRSECRALTPAARVELYQSLAALLRQYGCGVFVCGVEKAACRAHAEAAGLAHAHPHALAFQRLLECINGWLASRQPRAGHPELVADPLVGLLIADEQREVDRATVRSFASWRDRECGDEQMAAGRFLVDTIHFIPSTDSWLLQLADCVAYLRNRYEKVMRGKVAPGHALTLADMEIVNLWERFCAPVVESEEVCP